MPRGLWRHGLHGHRSRVEQQIVRIDERVLVVCGGREFASLDHDGRGLVHRVERRAIELGHGYLPTRIKHVQCRRGRGA
jgi:hypothetical protein